MCRYSKRIHNSGLRSILDRNGNCMIPCIWNDSDCQNPLTTGTSDRKGWMNMEQKFYLSSPEMITAHYGEEYEKYYNAIVPPIFMNSLNVFNEIDDYFDADTHDKHTYIYDSYRAGLLSTYHWYQLPLHQRYQLHFFHLHQILCHK